MAHIEWSSELDTGIDPIDKQHRRLIDYINELNDAKGKAGSREVVGEVLNEMVDYTLTHFSFEEELQEEAGYGFAKAHKRVHEMFVKRVGGYMERFKAGEDVAEEVHSMLKRWLVHHIMNDDSGYVPDVKRKLGLDGKAANSGWLSGALGRFFGGRES
jgi:hemerythrin